MMWNIAQRAGSPLRSAFRRSLVRVLPIRALSKQPSANLRPDDLGIPLTEVQADVLDPSVFYKALSSHGVEFYTGVPNSICKDFLNYVEHVHDPKKFMVTANEGAAISAAAGYHLATGTVPLTFCNTTEFGNGINPLLSLADPGVYGIPLILLAGWRGEPGHRDERHHIPAGKGMEGLLAAMNIPSAVLPDFREGAEEALAQAVAMVKEKNTPFVFLVKRDTFAEFAQPESEIKDDATMTREEVIRAIMAGVGTWDLIVANGGYTSRVLYQEREQSDRRHEQDFLTVGSIGHVNSIALGAAMAKPTRKVFCIDGDSAALMHLGAMASIGMRAPKNLVHILFNNGMRRESDAQTNSPGGDNIDFPGIAKGCGYKVVRRAKRLDEVREAMDEARRVDGPVLIEIPHRLGVSKTLGRPSLSMQHNKMQVQRFMEH